LWQAIFLRVWNNVVLAGRAGLYMKILVAVKRVVDAEVKVGVKPDGSGVDIADLKMSMKPFDEIAVEEAVRLKEAGVATEVVAVSCGLAQAQEALHNALMIGADGAIIVDWNEDLQPLATAGRWRKGYPIIRNKGAVICPRA